LVSWFAEKRFSVKVKTPPDYHNEWHAGTAFATGGGLAHLGLG
jgi:hypothetical protein